MCTLSQNGYGTYLKPNEVSSCFQICCDEKKQKKASGTQRASQAVPHPSTDRALQSLTSEFGWDRVYSMQYGRWQVLSLFLNVSFNDLLLVS